MRAGNVIFALDVTSSMTDGDDTTQANLSNTNFQPASPEVSTTFVAPTSGAVLVAVGGGLRDNTNTNQIMMAPEVRQNNVSGIIVMSPIHWSNSWTSSGFQTSNYQYGSRMVLLTGLTPGATYFARVMLAVSGGSSADSFSSHIFVIPTAG